MRKLIWVIIVICVMFYVGYGESSDASTKGTGEKIQTAIQLFQSAPMHPNPAKPHPVDEGFDFLVAALRDLLPQTSYSQEVKTGVKKAIQRFNQCESIQKPKKIWNAGLQALSSARENIEVEGKLEDEPFHIAKRVKAHLEASIAYLEKQDYDHACAAVIDAILLMFPIMGN